MKLRNTWSIVCAMAFAVAPFVKAATVTWDGSTDMTWTPSDATSWSGGTFNSGDEAIFAGAGAGTVTITGTVTPGAVNITSGSYTFSGIIGGSAAITNSGSGTLTLAGANTYTGGTTINSGTVTLGNAAALGNAAGAVSVASGAVLNMNGITVANTNPLTLNGSGIGGTGALLNSTGTGKYAGAITLAGNTTIGQTGGANLTFNGTTKLNTAGYTLTFRGSTAGTIMFDPATSGITGTGSVVVDGAYLRLVNGGGNISSSDYTGTTTLINGGHIMFFNNNIGTGNINLNGGTLGGYAASGLTTRGFGTGSNQIQITGGESGFGANGGVAINFTGVTEVKWGTASFNPSKFIVGGSPVGSDGVLTFQEGIDLDGVSRTILTTGTGGGVLSGVIRNTSGTSAGLIKEGGGALSPTANNTYNGPTTITAGTLIANSTGALGNGGAANTLIFNGGTLQASGAITSPSTRGVTMTSTGIIDSNGQTISIAGDIAGAGGLTKNGAGMLILSGTNNYSGVTTVNVGTLQVDSSLGASSTVNISGGVLDGTGTINGPVNVVAGGKLSTTTLTFNAGVTGLAGNANFSPAGQGTLGTMTVGSGLTLNAGNEYDCDLGTVDGSSDVIAITGDLVLNGTSYVAFNVPSGSAAANATYTIMTWTGSQTGGGTLVFPNGTTTMNGAMLNITANSVTITTGSSGITTGDRNVIWKGTSSYVWDSSTVNWDVSGTPTAYAFGDNVTFNDTGLAVNPVTGTPFNPASVTVSSSAKTYTIAASIGGSGALTKSGTSTLTLSGANTFTGDITINAGALTFSSTVAGVSGTGKNITFAGSGTLTAPNSYTAGQLSVSNSFTATILAANPITFATTTGSGTIVFSTGSAGTLNLGNASGFTGTIKNLDTYQGATVAFSKLSDTGNLQLAGQSSDSNQRVIFLLTGGSTPVTLNTSQIQLIDKVTQSANRYYKLQNDNASAVNKWVINTPLLNSVASRLVEFELGGSNTGDNEFAGVISNGSNSLLLNKVDGGKWILSGNNTFSGPVTVNGGTLTLSGLNQYTGSTTIGGTAIINTLKNYGVACSLGAAASGDIIFNRTTGGNLAYVGSGDTANRTIRLEDDVSNRDSGSSIYNNGTGALIFNGSTFNTPYVSSGNIGHTPALILGGTFDGSANEIRGVIADNEAASNSRFAITKNLDASIWKLSGVNTFTGATTVNGGALLLGGGSLNNTVVTLSGTSMFGVKPGSTTTISLGNSSGAASTGGRLILSATSKFDMTDGAVSSFNIIGNATTPPTALTAANGTTWKFDLGSSSADQVSLYKGASVTGVASITGTQNVSLSLATGTPSLTPGSYDLVKAGSGLAGTWQLFPVTGTNVVVGGNVYPISVSSSATAVTLTVGNATATTATNLAFTTQPSVNTVIGVPFAQQPVVQIQDASGTPVTLAGVFITLSGVPGLAGTVTVATDASGTATFSGINVATGGSGLILTASSGGLTATNSSAFNIIAGNGIYTQATSGGNWLTAGNWSGGIIASGSGNSANFNTLDITADNTVHLDLPMTLTSLIFGDSDIGTAAGWTVDNNGSSLNTLTLAGTTPSITVNALGGTATTTISAVLAGSTAWSKAGAGTLTLSGANADTAGATVSAGTLVLNESGTDKGISGSSLTVGAANNTAATVQYTGTSSDLIAAGTVSLLGQGSLDFNGKTDTIGAVTITATGSTAGSTPIKNTAGGGNLILSGTTALTITPVAGYNSVVNTGTGKLTLGGNVTFTAVGTGQAQITGTELALGAATRTFTVAAGTGANQDVLIDALISGSGGLTKAGAGTLALSGGTSSYTNITTITGGTLSVGTLANAGSNSDLGNYATAGAAGLVFSTGAGTLKYTGNTVSINRGFTGTLTPTFDVATANQTLTLGASSLAATMLTVNSTGGGGTLELGVLTITAGATLTPNTGNLTVTSVTGTNSGLTLSGSGVGTGTISGAITTGTGTLTKLGTGTWTLSGANTYSGGTTIGNNTANVGTLNITHGSALGTGLVSIVGNSTLTNPATLMLNSATGITVANNFKTSGVGQQTNGIIRNMSGTNTISGNISLVGGGGDTRIQSDGGSLTLSGTITNGIASYARILYLSGSATGTVSGVIVNGTATAPNTVSVTKAGTGTWTISNVNTYTGATTVVQGTLKLGVNNALPSTSPISIVDGTLDAQTYTDTTCGTLDVTGAGTINLGSGGKLVFADSSLVNSGSWAGTLNITGTFVSGSSLKFGTTSSGLTAGQLARISMQGVTYFALDGSGYLVAIRPTIILFQ